MAAPKKNRMGCITDWVSHIRLVGRGRLGGQSRSSLTTARTDSDRRGLCRWFTSTVGPGSRHFRTGPGPHKARPTCPRTFAGSARPRPRAGCGHTGAVGATRRRMHISAPPAAGPARGPWAASGPEELSDSERSHGCRRDAVTVCFQYLVLQVTVSDDSMIYSELALLHSELGVEIRILPFELGTDVLKRTARISYNPNRVWVSFT